MNPSINIYDLLDQLRLRKALFLGNGYTFHSLQAFLTGFSTAAQESMLEHDQYPNFSYFNTWILGHLPSLERNTGGWHWHIHQRNPNNDQKAFEEFFACLDIFKQSALSIKTILLDPEAIQFSIDSPIKRYTGTVMEDQYLQRIPSYIRWITISHSTTVWIEWLDQRQKSITDYWYFNAKEANEALQQEFGTFKHNWVEVK